MHIRPLTTRKVSKAYNIELILDVVLQFIQTLEAVERFLGVDLIDDFVKGDGNNAT